MRNINVEGMGKCLKKAILRAQTSVKRNLTLQSELKYVLRDAVIAAMAKELGVTVMDSEYKATLTSILGCMKAEVVVTYADK